MKSCPYCAEEIQDAAIVCKHCSRDLNLAAPTTPGFEPTPQSAAPPPAKATASGSKSRSFGGLFVLVGFLMSFSATTLGLGVLLMWVGFALMLSGGLILKVGGGMIAALVLSAIGASVSGSTSRLPSTSTPSAVFSERAPAAALESHLTRPQQNAARSATAYLRVSGFSRNGLIGQLSSEYGDKFSADDATVAVDSLDVDWNAQAARSAAQYLKISGFSCQGLIQQLSSDHGDKYTVEQATYGATQAGIC